MLRWFLDADDIIDVSPPKPNGPCTVFLEICMQIHSVVFALSRQITSKKYAKTIFFGQVIKFS